MGPGLAGRRRGKARPPSPETRSTPAGGTTPGAAGDLAAGETTGTGPEAGTRSRRGHRPPRADHYDEHESPGEAQRDAPAAGHPRAEQAAEPCGWRGRWGR